MIQDLPSGRQRHSLALQDIGDSQYNCEGLVDRALVVCSLRPRSVLVAAAGLPELSDRLN